MAASDNGGTTAPEATAAEPRHPRDLLRFATAGSVDDGKSTLVGRLLYDTKSVLADQIEAVHRAAVRRIPLGRVGQPSDIGGVVAFLCSPAAGLVTGHVMPVDGGWTAGEPELPL